MVMSRLACGVVSSAVIQLLQNDAGHGNPKLARNTPQLSETSGCTGHWFFSNKRGAPQAIWRLQLVLAEFHIPGYNFGFGEIMFALPVIRTVVA